MIDKKFIGYELPEAEWEVEKGRLRFFCKAIGENRAVYLDEAAAKAAGYRSLPAPPTFLFSAFMDTAAMMALLSKLEIPIGKILHGEQTFQYHTPACAGDVLKVRSRVADIYDKKGGALEFVVVDMSLTNRKNAPIVDMRSVIVVRH